MHCLLILSALFVGSLAAPAGGLSRPTNNGGYQTNAGLNGAPQIIPSGTGGAGGYSAQTGGANQAANTGAEQAAGAASLPTNNGVVVSGGALGGAGAGGASLPTNNGVVVGAGLGGNNGGNSNAADPLAGQNVGGGASNNADPYGNGGYGNGAAGAPVIIPNNAGGASRAGGEVNGAGLLAGQALTAQGMSAGAAAGIAIGVIAVAALGTAVAVMILRR